MNRPEDSSDSSKKRTEFPIDFHSEGFRKYFKNTSFLLGEKVFRLLVSFLVGVLVVRYLGPSNFGIFSYAMSIVALFTPLATLGLESIVPRELVRYPEQRDVYLGSAFAMRFLGGSLVVLFSLIAVLMLGDRGDLVTFVLMLAAATFFQAFNNIELLFQSRVEARYPVYVQISVLIVASGIKLGLMAFQASLFWFVAVTVLESALLAMGFVIAYRVKGMKLLHWRFKWDVARGLLRDSWPLILSGFAIAVYMRIDQVMIKAMLGETDVGYYAAAVRLCEAWYFVPMAVSTSLFPAIIRAKEHSEELYLNRLQKLYNILAWTAIAIAVPVTFLAEPIVLVLFGSEFLTSSPVLKVYIWASVATFLGVASSQYIVAENLTKISFYRTVIGMAVNVCLNLLLIPDYGILGAAVATLISFTAATFSIGMTRRTFSQFVMMTRSVLFIDLFLIFYRRWQSR